MKILLVSNMYPSEDDATFGTFVKIFNDGLIRQRPDYHVRRVVISGKPKNSVQKLFKYLKFYIRLLYILLFYRFDVVYVHTITYPTPPIWLISKIKKLNLFFNVHGVDVLTRSRLAERLKQMCRPLLSECRYIIVPSTYFEQVLLNEFHEINSNKIIVSASGGISSQFFSKRDFSNNNIIKIGFVSRITHGKGWDTFLDALKELDRLNKCYEAFIIGDGEEKHRLINAINQISGSNRINYLGPKGHNELPKFYKLFDLFIFPSESESLGLVGLEAMAASTPVIGSNIGGIATYINDGENGFLFEPKNSMELANEIIKYMDFSAKEKNHMMNMAYKTALNYESSKVLTTLFDKIFPK